MVRSCPQCDSPLTETALVCDRCGGDPNPQSPADVGPDNPYQVGYVVELGTPSQPTLFVPAGSSAVDRTVSDPRADEADHCLKCKHQGPGGHYRFFVAKKKGIPHGPTSEERAGALGAGSSPWAEAGLSHRIIHEQSAFICDRCARARVAFAPLVVLILWVPLLALAVLLTDLVVSVPLLFVTVILIRLAWRQCRAAWYRLYQFPPYSDSVARLAIKLEKREVLRSLHLTESEVTFLTESERVGMISRARGG